MIALLVAAVAMAAPAGLKKPSKATATAPARFTIEVQTTQGKFVLQAEREWAPEGVDRLYNLVKVGFFEDIAFFRAIDNFMVQFGIHGDPEVAKAWFTARIPDDAVRQSNARGTMSFATSGPNTRTTQLFINYRNNVQLDQMGFAPVARVVEGMDVVDKLYKGYGEGAPRGRGPDQGQIQKKGNAYLREKFPELDYIKSVTLKE